MNSSIQTITPLRQRMIDDMRMRKLSPKTQAGYIRVVKRFAGFLGRSPETASSEEVLSQIFQRLQAVLICGQNYPAKAINCL